MKIKCEATHNIALINEGLLFIYAQCSYFTHETSKSKCVAAYPYTKHKAAFIYTYIGRYI